MSRTLKPAFLRIDVAIADLYPDTQNVMYSVDLYVGKDKILKLYIV